MRRRLKSFLFISGVSIVVAGLATASGSGFVVAAAVAGGLALGRHLMLRSLQHRQAMPMKPRSDGFESHPRRGWHAVDRPDVERWSDGQTWTEFERPRLGPQRLIEVRTGPRAPGWHPESSEAGAAQRWWSGRRWTADRRPLRAGLLKRPGGIAIARMVGAAIVLVSLVVSQVAFSDIRAHADERGTVKRVVDGDTIDVQVGGTVKRVRLLNIDTPEVVDPNTSVECLGPEASEYAVDLLPVGTKVTLKFDGSTQDDYGRVLAALILEDGSNMSELIARRGLGTPLDLGHRRFLQSVEDASNEAYTDGAGLFDAAVACTAPAATMTLREEGAELFDAAPATAKLAAMDAFARKAETFLARIDDLDPVAGSLWRLYSAPQRGGMQSQVAALRMKATAAVSAPVRRRAELKATATAVADKEAAARAEKAAQRKAAKVRREKAARRAAAQAADDLQRQQDSADSSGGGGTGSSGYTGCRRYAPGGKTWEPIPC